MKIYKKEIGEKKEMAAYENAMTVGIALRGAFERALHQFCFHHDLVLVLKKVPGIFSSDFYFRVEGSMEECFRFKAWLEALYETFNTEDK